MNDDHDETCPPELVEHIADIEAGWTLPQSWNRNGEEVTEKEKNIEEVREMLERWAEHGIEVRYRP